MKQKFTKFMWRDLLIALISFAFLTTAVAQNSYTFTNCSATGQIGPSQAQANTAYLATNLAGSVTISGQGIQQFTIPNTGAYRIEAWGAQGGPNWGRGAFASGEFTLNAGTVLQIIVGQAGGSGNSTHGSGGGGSFIATITNSPLVVAGGGGGKGASAVAPALAYSHGSAGTAGQGPPGGGPGGTGGGGGASASGATGGTSLTPGANAGGSCWASGGGGFYTNGGTYVSNTAQGGRSFVNGGLGGDISNGCVPGSQGGFGGGGGNGDRGAGGGGFSGGGGATSNADSGGGGGSYSGGANPTFSAGINLGQGRVVITPLCNILLSFQTVNNTAAFCIGNSATLTTNAVSGYSWSTGATTQSIVVTPTVNTTYIASGTSSANCTAFTAITLTINSLPSISSAVTPNLLCVGSSATLSASGASTYTWNAGGSPNSYTNVVSPNVTTSYTVTATDINGCVNSVVQTVQVNTIVMPAVPSATICAGQSATLTATGCVSYLWSNGSPFQTFFASPTTNTVYSVSGLDINNCPQSTTVAVAVNPLPNVTGLANRPTICRGESVTLTGSGAANYSWSQGPTNIGTSNPLTLTPALDITYYYVVSGTDANNCTNSATVSVAVGKCTGVADNLKAGNVEVYPNPSTGQFNINLSGGNRVTISVYNALGKLIRNQTTSSDNISVDLQNEAAGVYMINVTENNKLVYSNKLIKQ